MNIDDDGDGYHFQKVVACQTITKYVMAMSFTKGSDELFFVEFNNHENKEPEDHKYDYNKSRTPYFSTCNLPAIYSNFSQ